MPTDQELREEIPTLASVETKYRPTHDWLMVIRIPALTTVGNIILPDKSPIVFDEGHIVAMGPTTDSQWKEGDCICWEKNSAMDVTIDGAQKVTLIRPGNVFMKIPKEKEQRDWSRDK